MMPQEGQGTIRKTKIQRWMFCDWWFQQLLRTIVSGLIWTAELDQGILDGFQVYWSINLPVHTGRVQFKPNSQLDMKDKKEENNKSDRPTVELLPVSSWRAIFQSSPIQKQPDFKEGWAGLFWYVYKRDMIRWNELRFALGVLAELIFF